MLYSEPKNATIAINPTKKDTVEEINTANNINTQKVEFVDKSDLLFAQMNFIAINNKSFLHIK